MADDHANEIVHREIDTERDEPKSEIVEIIAELEGAEATELAMIWETIDDVLVHIFDDPPSPEAQIEISFSYEGYRITVEQNGTARFVELSD